MRFSTVAVLSAAALSSSVVASPVAYDYDLIERDGELIQVRGPAGSIWTRDNFQPQPTNSAAATSSAPSSSATSAAKPTATKKAHKKLTAAQRKKYLSASRMEYLKAQKEFKAAEAHLAAAQKHQKLGMEKTPADGKKAKKDNSHSSTVSGSAKPTSTSTAAATATGKPASKRAVVIDELLEMIARGDNFQPQPANSAAATTSSAPSSSSTSAAKPTATKKAHKKHTKPLTAAQRKYLSVSRLEYLKAQNEFKAAEAHLAAAQKHQKLGMEKKPADGKKAKKDSSHSSTVSGSAKPTSTSTAAATATAKPARRAVDVDELLEIIARGYYGDFDEDYE